MAEKNFGEIFLEDDGVDKDGKPKTKLKISVDGKNFVGTKNERKSADTHPDYRISDAAGAEVGAAWKGVTSKNNQKLSLKINGFDKTLTAVMSKDPKDSDPDMIVMPMN